MYQHICCPILTVPKGNTVLRCVSAYPLFYINSPSTRHFHNVSAESQ